MSHDNGRKQQEAAAQAAANAAQAAANTAIAKAETPDPLEQRRRDFVTSILDWREGKKGPLDVMKFPDQTAIALYNNAKAVHDAGRVGKGYGSLADGVNPNYAAALDKENEMDRQQAASGELENFINNSLASADAETGNLWGAADARNMQIAGLRNANSENAQSRYLQLILAPKPPGFLRSFASGLGAGVGGAATSWAI